MVKKQSALTSQLKKNKANTAMPISKNNTPTPMAHSAAPSNSNYNKVRNALTSASASNKRTDTKVTNSAAVNAMASSIRGARGNIKPVTNGATASGFKKTRK